MGLSAFSRSFIWPALMALAVMARPATASESELDEFVPVSLCGVRGDSRIVQVTTTDPAAPGGLLTALGSPGPKIITFAVGGVISLNQDIDIATPFTTIAGETAPEPGITLTGGSVRIRSHDICIRHVSVRPGPAASPARNSTRDGIAIGGNPRKSGGAVERVLIENVSVSWGIDENISIWHEGTNTVQVRSTIIAEALRNAGHPKGAHSMGMLIASDVTNISISDSIFAHNNDRNPRISPNAQVFMRDNLIYNPGNMSTEVFLNCDREQYAVSLIRNLYIPGSDTRRGQHPYNFVDAQTRARIADAGTCRSGLARVTQVEANQAEAKRVYDERLKHTGARPFFRNPDDARIIADIQNRTGHIRDSAPPPETGRRAGYSGGFAIPRSPFHVGANGQPAIAAALCEAHLRLGGLPSRGCAARAATK